MNLDDEHSRKPVNCAVCGRQEEAAEIFAVKSSAVDDVICPECRGHELRPTGAPSVKGVTLTGVIFWVLSIFNSRKAKRCWW
jgi:hypothetical protein